MQKHNPKSTCRLHLGCGLKRLDGWINIDAVAAVEPDLCHDLAQPLPYPAQSADAILAEDLLEHFDKYQRYLVVGDWARVLRVGGELTVQVPDVGRILLKLWKMGLDNTIDVLFGENLLRSEVYLGHFGNHKYGYSRRSLIRFLALFGLQTARIERRGRNLRYTGSKLRHVDNDELDALQIYSYANDHGQGRASVSLGEVRERMDHQRSTAAVGQAPSV